MTQNVMENGELRPMTVQEQADYDALQAAYTSGARVRLLAALSAYRYSVQNGGCQISLTINGTTANHLFLTDINSQFALTGALLAAQANSGYTVNWKMADGSFLTLNAANIISAWQQGAVFVQKCFSTEETIKSNIANYSDIPGISAAFDSGMAS